MAPPVITHRPLLPKIESGSSSASPPLLDDVPDGESAPKRRCISNACMPCRRRKSKCDGEKPSCNACTAVYDSQCYYDLDSDHRRKGALKRDIRQLKEENEKRDTILEAIKKGSEADVDDIIQLVRANPDEPYDSIVESIKKCTINLVKNPEPPSLEGELADFSGKAALDKAGETRHYGHTSDLAWMGYENDDLPAMATDQLGRWTSVTEDSELTQHLMSLYFAWSHPFYLMFPEEVFYHGMHNKKLKYCTPLLVNAILALACNYSDRPEARQDPNDPSTIGNHFFTEAKRLLAEDDRSCLTTVQALGIMSLRQAMNNHDSSGWKYAGQMINMAVELGLHMTYRVQRNGTVTPTEIEARRITFWGCYALETAWCICMGRISSLPRTAIQLDKPYLRDILERKPWRPQGDAHLPQELAVLEQPSFTYNLLVQLSTLSEIVNDTVQMFYAPRDRITSRKLQHHHGRFQLWYNELPAVLAVRRDVPTLPQVIALHAYYHNCVLHLFRPFLRFSFVQNTKYPRQICSEAAITICNLMRLHSRLYTLKRTFFLTAHCVMSSAIIHLVNISGENLDHAVASQAAAYLADAIRMLYEMHPSIPLVTRYLKALRTLLSQWVTEVPEIVLEALETSEFPSPVPSHNNSGTSPPQTTTNLDYDASPSTEVDGHGDRKDSAPEIVQMAPSFHENIGNTFTHGNSFFWTPFPDSMDGIPILPVETSSDMNLDTSAMMESGVGGDWSQMNRDGFMTEDVDISRALWGYGWEHYNMNH